MRRVKRKDDSEETVYILDCQNYKAYDDAGFSSNRTERYTAILDTGARSSSIRRSHLPSGTEWFVREPSTISAKDTYGKLLALSGKLVFMFVSDPKMGTRHALCCRRAAHLSDTWLWFLWPTCWRFWSCSLTVQLEEGTFVPIVLKPTSHLQSPLRLRTGQEYIIQTKCMCPEIQIISFITSQPDSQNQVQVKTKRKVLIPATPIPQSYEKHLCLEGSGIQQMKSEEPFCILIADFGKESKTFLPNQAIAIADMDPTALMESDVTHEELLGTMEEEKLSTESLRSGNHILRFHTANIRWMSVTPTSSIGI